MRPMASAMSEQIIFDDVLSYEYFPPDNMNRFYFGVDPAAFGVTISIQDIADPENDKKWSKVRALLKRNVNKKISKGVLAALSHITVNSVDAVYKVYDALAKESQAPDDKVSIQLKITRTKDFIKIRVRDKGNGIPANVLEAWERGELISKSKDEGDYFGQHGRGSATSFLKLAQIGAITTYRTTHNGASWMFTQALDGSRSHVREQHAIEGTEVEIKVPVVKIALTGATGFLGSNILQVLDDTTDAPVNSLIRTPTKARVVSERFAFSNPVIGDLLDFHSLQNVMRGNNVFINAAADSSTNILPEDVTATAEIIAANTIAPALALMVAQEENKDMRKIFISSFDVDKVPGDARPWIEAKTKRIVDFVKEYVTLDNKGSYALHRLSFEIARDLNRQKFKAFSYPVSKALMDSVLLKLADELQASNIIILRTMGLVGKEMRSSSNSGFLIKLVDAILTREYLPAGKKLTPYKGTSASLILVTDVARALRDLATVDLDDRQMAKPIIVELGGERIGWKDAVAIIADKTQKLTGPRENLLKNVIFRDPPENFVNVERSTDLATLEQLLKEGVKLTPIKQAIEDLVEAECPDIVNGPCKLLQQKMLLEIDSAA